MAWKKAWPTEVKQKLKTTYGLTNENIATLENYGSLEVLQAKKAEWQTKLAWTMARADELVAYLKTVS
jgi:hypothetical protein